MVENGSGENVRDLIDEMLAEDDFDKRSELADKVLSIDRENPIAKYTKWQLLDENESMEQVSLLRDSVNILRSSIESHEENVDEETYTTYLAMLADFTSILYFKGEKDAAFKAAQELIDLDDDGFIQGRIVYYSVLIERGEYQRVIDAVEADICETPVGGYCRAIALLELGGEADDASDAVLQAISLDPDMAFYVTDIWTLDESEIEEMFDDDMYIDSLIMQTFVLTDLWSSSDERLEFLSSIVFTFGYLTGRVTEPEDLAAFEEKYKNAGCLDEMREARDTIHAMQADGKEQDEVDEEALLLFKDMRDRGLFS
jgi:tetratricopeptide (TPR) repeat protein